jgi:hypothetical protein
MLRGSVTIKSPHKTIHKLIPIPRVVGGPSQSDLGSPSDFNDIMRPFLVGNGDGHPWSQAKSWSTASVQKQKLRVVNR